MNYKTELMPGHFGLVPKDQQTRRVMILAEITDPYRQKEVGLLLHKGARRNYVWNSRDPLGYPCPTITVNGQVQVETGVISKVSEPS